MTNQERISARIERDKARRQQKKLEKNADYNDLNKIFTLKNHLEAVKICQKGVMWKASAQNYSREAIFNGVTIVDTYKNGNVIPLRRMKKEEIRERGKLRIITPIHFDDRVPQRMMCNYSLVPMIENVLIHDNCASMPNKGIDYARKRVDKFLSKAQKLWGNEFYALVTDFKDFFGSIPHSTCYTVLNELYDNKDIVDLLMKIILSYPEAEIRNSNLTQEEKKKSLQDIADLKGVGICLGSQISQMMALLVPNKLDHFVKDNKRVKFYIRYMDDCLILHNDKEFLWELYEGMKAVATELGLHFNEKKTRLVSVRKGFKFLKIHYKIVENNRIIRTLDRNTVSRQRRKLKRFKRLVDNGDMSKEDVLNSMQSWLSHSTYAKNSYKTVKRMKSLYNSLYDGYKLSGRYRRGIIMNGGKGNNEVLQSYRWSELLGDWNDRRPEVLSQEELRTDNQYRKHGSIYSNRR